MAYMMDYMWGGWDGGHIFPFFGLGMMLLWLVLIIFIAYLVYTGFKGPSVLGAERVHLTPGALDPSAP